MPTYTISEADYADSARVEVVEERRQELTEKKDEAHASKNVTDQLNAKRLARTVLIATEN